VAKAERDSRRVTKGKRRARSRGVDAEKIDPLKVFQRDGWRCHLCGKHAPPKLRGTLSDLAPELDHVIPLAKGGHHKWSNVALAHRMCNAAKSDTPRGQLMFEGFATV